MVRDRMRGEEVKTRTNLSIGREADDLLEEFLHSTDIGHAQHDMSGASDPERHGRSLSINIGTDIMPRCPAATDRPASAPSCDRFRSCNPTGCAPRFLRLR